MSYGLPRSLEVNGKEYPIRTDFRDILKIIEAINDPDLEDKEKVYVSLFILYPDFDDFNVEDIKDAYMKACEFIDCGLKTSEKKKSGQKIMDFIEDEALIIPAINKVAGKEIREMEYLHWWTFMGYYMEIGESTYSTVIHIRSKKQKHKKLEKWEEEFYSNNKELIDLKEKVSEEEKEEKERLLAML